MPASAALSLLQLRQGGGYSPAAPCGLLIVVASAAEHKLRALGLQQSRCAGSAVVASGH